MAKVKGILRRRSGRATCETYPFSDGLTPNYGFFCDEVDCTGHGLRCRAMYHGQPNQIITLQGTCHCHQAPVDAQLYHAPRLNPLKLNHSTLPEFWQQVLELGFDRKDNAWNTRPKGLQGSNVTQVLHYSWGRPQEIKARHEGRHVSCKLGRLLMSLLSIAVATHAMLGSEL